MGPKTKKHQRSAEKRWDVEDVERLNPTNLFLRHWLDWCKFLCTWLIIAICIWAPPPFNHIQPHCIPGFYSKTFKSIGILCAWVVSTFLCQCFVLQSPSLPLPCGFSPPCPGRPKPLPGPLARRPRGYAWGCQQRKPRRCLRCLTCSGASTKLWPPTCHPAPGATSLGSGLTIGSRNMERDDKKWKKVEPIDEVHWKTKTIKKQGACSCSSRKGCPRKQRAKQMPHGREAADWVDLELLREGLTEEKATPEHRLPSTWGSDEDLQHLGVEGRLETHGFGALCCVCTGV